MRIVKYTCGFILCSFIAIITCFVSIITVQASSNPIYDGWYVIENGVSSNLVLDVQDYNMSNGGNIQLYRKSGVSCQTFYVQYQNNGYYSIQAAHSNKYIHCAGARNGNGDNVHQWEGNSATGSQWALESAGNGYYYLRCRSGLYMDNNGGTSNPGNNVQRYEYNGTAAQRWRFVSTSKPSFTANYTEMSAPGGEYKKTDSRAISGRVIANYPITKIQVAIYKSDGNITDIVRTMSDKNVLDLPFGGLTLSFSSLNIGNYYYQAHVWNANGDIQASPKYTFSIKEDNPRPIYDGWYVIENGVSSNLVLDVQDYNMSNGSLLQVNKRSGSLSQIFYLSNIGNGYYSIKAAHSNLYVYCTSNMGGNKESIQQTESNSSNGAQWTVESAGDGYCYLRCKTGMYLDNYGGNTSGINNVQGYSKNNSPSQKWKLTVVSKPDFSVVLENFVKPSENESEIKVEGRFSSNYPITKLVYGIYSESGKAIIAKSIYPNVKSFSISKVIDASSIPDGDYFFGFKAENAQKDYWNSDKFSIAINHRDDYIRIENNTYIIRSEIDPNYVVDVSGGKTSDGTNISLYTYRGKNNQKFKIKHVSDGWYRIIDSKSGKSLDVKGGSKNSKTNVQLLTYKGTAGQLWRFYSAGKNTYYIKNKLGCYLDVTNGIAKNKANIQVYKLNRTKAQKWRVISIDDIENEKREMVSDMEKDYSQRAETYNSNINVVIKEIDNSCDQLKENEKKSIENKVRTTFSSTAPQSVSNSLYKMLVDDFLEGIRVKPTSYDNVKNPIQLVNKVAKGISMGTYVIEFSSENITYVADLSFIAESGASFSVGTITKKGTSSGGYTIGIVSTNQQDIQKERDNLKKYAQDRIEDAKKALKKDAMGLLIPSELKNYMKKILSCKVYDMLKKYSPKLEMHVKNGIAITEKFMKVQSTYSAIKTMDLTKMTPSEVAKKITTYSKNVEEYQKAVNSLME